MSIPAKIIISGQAYLENVDSIETPKIGDILLYVISNLYIDYYDMGYSGSFKGKVFDGKNWHHIDLMEFCQNREHKFSKKEKLIDVAFLCKEILRTFAGVNIFKTYRGHFSLEEYEQGQYIRKKKWIKN